MCSVFRSLIQFELIFVDSVKFVFRFVFASGCLVVLAPLVGKTIFAPLYFFYSFVKDQLTILIGIYFWGRRSIDLVDLLIN